MLGLCPWCLAACVSYEQAPFSYTPLSTSLSATTSASAINHRLRLKNNSLASTILSRRSKVKSQRSSRVRMVILHSSFITHPSSLPPKGPGGMVYTCLSPWVWLCRWGWLWYRETCLPVLKPLSATEDAKQILKGKPCLRGRFMFLLIFIF